MKKTALIALLSVVGWIGTAAASPEKTGAESPATIGQRIPQFSAQVLDASGKTPHPSQFDSHRTKRITTYIFVGTHCPATQAYAERLTQLEQTYAPQGVDFVYIYPNQEDTPDAKVAFHAEKKFKGRLIDDQGAKLAHLLGAQRTSELFLTNKKGTIVYHGAIDDSRDPAGVKQRYLAMALDATLAGKPVAIASSDVFA